MTAPDGGAPPGSLAVGLFAARQATTVEQAKGVMAGGVLGAFEHTQDELHDNYNGPIGERPTFTQTHIDFSMWGTMNPKEHPSIPRSTLLNGAAGSTSSGGSGDNSHTHTLGQTPQYKPDPAEGECAFIRMVRDADLRYVGFCTGNDGLLATSIANAHIGVYKCDTSTGVLTLMTPSLATLDIKAQLETELTEFVFDFGTTIEAKQNDIFAVIQVQNVTGFQSPGAIMGVRIRKTGRWNGAMYPYFPYCWTDLAAGGVLPSTIPAANCHWNNDPMTVPFVFLREE